MLYRLTAVKADGTGFDHFWGDTYEVEAPDYLAAERDVLGREGTDGKQSYVKIVKGSAWDGWRWVQFSECTDCRRAVAQTVWADTWQEICWDCCNVRQGRS